MKRLAACLILGAVLTACATTRGEFTTIEGTTYDPVMMEQVQAGMSLAEVMDLVGEPHEKEDREEGTLYRYFMVREKLDYNQALGVFSVEKKTTRTDTAELLFSAAGRLLNKKVQYTETRPKQRGEK